MISQTAGVEPAYPGQVGPEVSPVSEELLHRAIRSNVELAESLGLLVREVSASLAAIQVQVDALTGGAPPAPAALAIRAETDKVRRALQQLGPVAQAPVPARAPAPPLVPAPPSRPAPLSPETISVAGALAPPPRPQSVFARVSPSSSGAHVSRPPMVVAPRPAAPAPAPAPPGSDGPTAPALAPPPGGPEFPAAPRPPVPALPGPAAAPPAAVPAPAPPATLDALLVEVVRAQRAVLAARPVGVESRIPRGTPLPRSGAERLKAALGSALSSAAATARPSTVVSARAERKPVLLRARDGSEIRRDFVMVALTQQGGPSEGEQQAILAGRGQGPLAETQRQVKEAGGFLRFAPLPQGGFETRLFLPA